MKVTAFGTLAHPDRSGRSDVVSVAMESSLLRISLLNLGASLHTVECPDRGGARTSVHLALGTLADYEDHRRNPYLGATVGRYANRIAFATFELDGRTVRLAPNEGPHQLHGGPEGFARRIWAVTDATDQGDGGRVRMELTSPDGDGGYPGTLKASVTYSLRGATLSITYEAVTDAPTVVNLASHGYWNLGGPDLWDQPGSIGSHELRVDAAAAVPAGADALPTGPPEPVAGTRFDLRRPLAIEELLDRHPHGVDHCYALRPPPAADPRTVPIVAELHDPGSGRTLTVATDQPALQVYTANHLGDPFAPHAAVCLEAQRFPDAPNRPELGSVVLRPGDRYRSATELTFSVR